jgi:hypothetical protein
MWEYVIESFAEQPSIQDLIATPIMGSVVGELFHRWSVAILRKERLNFGQKALVFFLNLFLRDQQRLPAAGVIRAARRAARTGSEREERSDGGLA